MVRRLIMLRMLVDSCTLPVSPAIDQRIAFVTIEALNVWASFAREYYLSCAVMRPKREGGSRVTIGVAGIHDEADAIDLAIKNLKGHLTSGPPWSRRDEPAWHETRTLLGLARAVQASNLGQVQAAFSIRTRVFLHLPTARNFFAHRNGDTAGRVATVARANRVNPFLRPSEVLCTVPPRRPQPLLSDWLDDMRRTITLLCQ